MYWDLEDLAGLGDLAAIHGVSKATASNWLARFDDFPRPLVTLSTGPVYSRRQVAAWYQARDWTHHGRVRPSIPAGLVTVLHARKPRTQYKTVCRRWAGKLPLGEHLTSDMAQVTCRECRDAM